MLPCLVVCMRVSDSPFPFSDVTNSEFGKLFNTQNVIGNINELNDERLNDNLNVNKS